MISKNKITFGNSAEIMFDSGNSLKLRNASNLHGGLFSQRCLTSNNMSLNSAQPTTPNPLVSQPVLSSCVTHFRQAEWLSQGETFCHIDKDGRLIRNGIDITDNDKAMAECFVDYLKKFQKIEVKRGSQES